LQIFIVPVILEDDKQYYQEEQKRYAPQIEADFYSILIKQLQRIFSRIMATTTRVSREMSQASATCEFNACRNGMTTSVCSECGEHFCDEHMKDHLTEHTDKP
jgi:hypothetical protein